LSYGGLADQVADVAGRLGGRGIGTGDRACRKRLYSTVAVAGGPLLDPEKTLRVRGTTYRIVAVQGPEVGSLAPLFRESFGLEFFTPGWLRRKYACEAGGLPAFSCVALAKGAPVAACGVLPWTVRLGEQVEVGGQIVDVATASEHRRRGLFTHLAQAARDICEAAGVAFVYALPHPDAASYRLFVGSLGYQHLHDLVEYTRPVPTLQAERRARLAALLRPPRERRVKRTLSVLLAAEPVLSNSLVGDGFAGVERGGAFHAYKTAFGGSFVAALDRGRAWLKVDRHLQVGDLEASSDGDLERTMHALVLLAKRLGVHEVRFQASRDTRFDALARHVGTRSGLAAVYRNLSSAIPAERLRFTLGDLDNF
jgi:hypothetical protein